MSGTDSATKASAEPTADKMNGSSDEGNDTASEGQASAPPALSITSDEVNYLIYRYLQEAGFVHSAYTFSNESLIVRSNMRSVDKNIPPGALITFLQKGLQYVGIEETLRLEGDIESGPVGHGEEENGGTTLDMTDFTLLSPQAMNALNHENPPIQLNVPPATAAAAVRARLEVEAKLQEAAKAAAVEQAMLDPSLVHAGIPSQHAMEAQQPYIGGKNALTAHAAAAHAAAASAMSQLGGHGALTGSEFPAAAFVVHQQRAAELASLQEQEQAQAAAALASVAGGNRSSNKVKKSKKATSSSDKNALHLQQDSGRGIANLEEAVARLETKSRERGPTSMDIDEDEQTTNGGRTLDQNGDIRKVPLNGQADAAVALASAARMSEDEERRIELEDQATEAASAEVLELRKHASEVFMCAWNPVYTDLIATGSGDASARIWQMSGPDAAAGCGPVRLLPHGTDPSDRKNKDVTTLEWSSDGTLLATGSYDGVARVWSRTGSLVHTLQGHRGPIFSLKWNRRGNFILSGSYDKTTIVWDVSGDTGIVHQQFSDHQAPALDVDWKDDITFASCSTDKTVLICQVGITRPLRSYTGHGDEVNAVKWDPSGTLLASCSDDCTAKVWDVNSDRSDPLYDLKSHQQEIYTVKWSPTGPGSVNPQKDRMLATASFDGSVRLWDVQNGSCIRIFSRHRDSVYSVAFSPSGDYLASGSLAGQLYIWNVREGNHVKSFKGKGDIFEVAWNVEETRVAACFSSNVVSVIDFKKP